MNMRPAALAQLVEHLTRNEKVVSSILTGGSLFHTSNVGGQCAMLKIEILHIDECPNWHQAEDRVRSVLAELGASTVAVDTKLMVTRDEAAAVALAGLPSETQLRDVLSTHL
jgi:hypothetical protein